MYNDLPLKYTMQPKDYAAVAVGGVFGWLVVRAIVRKLSS